jgi:uncharacterized protein (DUF1684 family)
MRSTIIPLVAFLTLLLSCTSERAPEYPKQVNAYRDSVDATFRHVEHTILLPEDLTGFQGLSYFPADAKYRVQAVFQRIENGDTFRMFTSTDRRPLYQVYGKLEFQLDMKSYELTLYQNQDALKKDPNFDEVFCPFKDLTNGNETYGGGRYLDFKLSQLGNPVIDFNYCYNPYCAYNYKYSCPIPPKENHLNVRIPAGVKKFH